VGHENGKVCGSKCEMLSGILKETTVIYGLQLASKLDRLDCSHWFCSEYNGEYQNKLSTDHFVEVHFAEVT